MLSATSLNCVIGRCSFYVQSIGPIEAGQVRQHCDEAEMVPRLRMSSNVVYWHQRSEHNYILRLSATTSFYRTTMIPSSTSAVQDCTTRWRIRICKKR